jgi:hypothetical protein
MFSDGVSNVQTSARVETGMRAATSMAKVYFMTNPC